MTHLQKFTGKGLLCPSLLNPITHEVRFRETHIAPEVGDHVVSSDRDYGFTARSSGEGWQACESR